MPTPKYAGELTEKVPTFSQAELSASAERWMAAMYKGDFERAWRETDLLEWPRRVAERNGRLRREPHHLTWNGAPFAGQRVLVRCEHGLGDSVQYLRYCPLLQQRAAGVIVKAQPALLRLLTGMRGIDLLRNGWTTDPDPAHDVAIECMELAYAFRHTPATLPAEVPYLPVREILARAPPLPWQEGSKLRVGLIWASSAWDPRRSLPLSALAPLAALRETHFYSLQQGPEETEADGAAFPLTSLSAHTRDVCDAAAAMLQMDLVISVDSMTAHLAGALGRPTRLLLTHQADWRWMHDRLDSPWYPTMRLYRQPQPGAWEPVIAALVQELRTLERRRRREARACLAEAHSARTAA